MAEIKKTTSKAPAPKKAAARKTTGTRKSAEVKTAAAETNTESAKITEEITGTTNHIVHKPRLSTRRKKEWHRKH